MDKIDDHISLFLSPPDKIVRRGKGGGEKERFNRDRNRQADNMWRQKEMPGTLFIL